MDKKILAFIVAVVIIIFGGVIYLLNDSGTDTSNSETTNVENSDSVDSTPELTSDVSSTGKYVEYSESVIADTSGTKLLFFHAPWCTQCRDLEADIETNGVPNGVTIIKVDYDSNQALRQTYGVTLQTTVVRVDDDGNLVSKFVAYDDPTVNAVAAYLL